MKYTLIVKPEAELDMLKSAKWYEEKQENLGIKKTRKNHHKSNRYLYHFSQCSIHFPFWS